MGTACLAIFPHVKGLSKRVTPQTGTACSTHACSIHKRRCRRERRHAQTHWCTHTYLWMCLFLTEPLCGLVAMGTTRRTNGCWVRHMVGLFGHNAQGSRQRQTDTQTCVCTPAACKVKGTRTHGCAQIFEDGSKLTTRFWSMFPLLSFHLGYLFLTHSQIRFE